MYINSVEITDLPKGLESIVFSVERDPKLDAVFYEYSSELEFVGDGYTALKTIYDNNTCSVADLQIDWRCDAEGTYETIFEGVIQLYKVEFNLSRCTCRIETPQSYIQGLISNNWKIEGVLSADKSVQRGTITAATDVDLDFFQASSGNYLYSNRLAYSVFEAFKWLVAYMTNGEVGFISTLFGSGGDWEYTYIINGISLRDTAAETAPDISFYDLYVEMNKVIPLGMWVEDIAGAPTLRIEERSYFYNGTNQLTFRNIDGSDGLRARTRDDQLYASVRLGSGTYLVDNTLTFPDNGFFGFTEQVYGFNTACNTDTELNLLNEWIIDSNVIESVLETSNDDYDEEIFIVIGEEFSLGQFRAIKYSDGVASGNYYNEPLISFRKADRWESYIPTGFNKWLGLQSVDNTCDVNLGADTGTIGITSTVSDVQDPVQFDTEVYDNGNNFDSTTNYRYTVPTTGQYRVHVDIYFRVEQAFGIESTIDVNLRHRDSGGTDISIFNAERVVQNNVYAEEFVLVVETSILASATDYFDIEVTGVTDTSTADVILLAETKFEVLTAPGTVVQFDQGPDAAPLSREYEFSYPMNKSDWSALRNATNQSITINEGGDTADDKVCWIKSANYRPQDGEADFVLLGT